MLSSNTLKNKITTKHSTYAAIFVFSLYSAVIVLLLVMFRISWLTSPLFFLLLVIAVYGAAKAYQQKWQLKFSDSGRVEVFANGILTTGVVSSSSFYNGFFIFLQLKKNPDDFYNTGRQKTTFVVIYRDAVKEPEYRTLARLINFCAS